MINAGGNKIAPSAVERPVIAFLGDSEPVHAFGLPGPDGYDEVVVIVSMRSSHRIKELPAVLEQAKLGLGKVHFLAIKSFPLNESGKVDRAKLREMAGAEIARQSSTRPR